MSRRMRVPKETNMSEPVPLRPTLSVQFVPIIVDSILGLSLDLVFEAFSFECWNFWVI